MVAIRLARTGAKKKPSYRVVVMDKRRPRDGRNIEIVGHYNPRPDPIELVLKRDRIDYWLGLGAQPSDTVKRLLKHFDKHGPSLAVGKSKNGAQPEPAPKQTAGPDAVAPSAPEPEAPAEEAVAEPAEASEQTPEIPGSTAAATAEEPEAVPAEPAAPVSDGAEADSAEPLAAAPEPPSGPAPAGAAEPTPSGVQADEGARE